MHLRPITGTAILLLCLFSCALTYYSSASYYSWPPVIRRRRPTLYCTMERFTLLIVPFLWQMHLLSRMGRYLPLEAVRILWRDMLLIVWWMRRNVQYTPAL